MSVVISYSCLHASKSIEEGEKPDYYLDADTAFIQLFCEYRLEVINFNFSRQNDDEKKHRKQEYAMTFLSPTTDIAFKKLFGSQERADLTISFLNSVLERREGELITLVQINDGANKPVTQDMERTFVDVACTDQKNNKYIIEVQVKDEKNFMERSQFYASFFLVRQLEKKVPFMDLVPVLFVGVLDFSLFKDDPDYLSHHVIVNSKTGKRTLRHLEWHFVELKKFTIELDDLVTPLEKWTYFLKHANEMNQIPATMKTSQELVTAFDVLEQHRWSEAELQKYYAELNDWRCAMDLERGARAEGRVEGKIETAKNMLADGLSIENISKYTGLTPSQVQELKNLQGFRLKKSRS